MASLSPEIFIAEITVINAETLATDVITVSDSGYVDNTGPWAYPPHITDAFQLNRSVNLDPSSSGCAAAWGRLSLINQDRFYDTWVQNYSVAGNQVRILYGRKTYEDYTGYGTVRLTTGTYLNGANGLQTAAAGVVRYSWESLASGLATSETALNEAAATNIIVNSQSASLWTTTADSTVTTSTAVTALFAGSTIKRSIVATAGAGNKLMGFLPQPEATATAYVASLWIWIPSTSGVITSVTLRPESGAASVVAVRDANQSLTDQWQRISVRYTSNATSSNLVIRANGAAPSWTMYYCCSQLETGTSPTSYIPTTGTAVTRAADNLQTSRGIWIDPPYGSLTTVFSGIAASWNLTETELQVELRDATFLLENKPVQSDLFTALDGDGSLVNVKKPMLRSQSIAYISPVLIHSAKLIYQYSDAAGGFSASGLLENRTAVFTSAGNVTDLTVGTTPAGQYRTTNSKAQFQLGSTPVGTITLNNVQGQFATAGAVLKASDIAYSLMVEEGGLDPGYLNTSSFTSAASSYGYNAGLYFDPNDGSDILGAVDGLLSSFAAKLVPKRDGTLKVWVLRTPADPTPVVIFNKSNIISITPKPLPSTLDPPVYRWKVAFAHNYSPSATTAVGTGTAKSDGISTSTNNDTLALFAKAQDHAIFGGALQSSTNTDTVAGDLNRLFSVIEPLVFTVTVDTSSGTTLPVTPHPGALVIAKGMLVKGTNVDTYLAGITSGNLTLAKAITTTVTSGTTITVTGWGQTATARPRRLYDVTVPTSIGLALDLSDPVGINYPMDDLDKTAIIGQVIGDTFQSNAASMTFTILV